LHTFTIVGVLGDVLPGVLVPLAELLLRRFRGGGGARRTGTVAACARAENCCLLLLAFFAFDPTFAAELPEILAAVLDDLE